MNTILSAYSASISDLKRNPSQLIEEANGEAVVILNHNRPTAYLIPAATFERISELLEDIELGKVIAERSGAKANSVVVSLDEL